MVLSGGDGGDAGPVIQAAPVKSDFSCGDHGAIFFQADGKGRSGGDGGDILPVADITLPLVITAHSPDCAITMERDGMILAECDGNDLLRGRRHIRNQFPTAVQTDVDAVFQPEPESRAAAVRTAQICLQRSGNRTF